MITLPDHLLLEQFYKLQDFFVLLNSPLPKGETNLGVEEIPELDFGLLRIDKLKMGTGGVYVGYKINIGGKYVHNPYFLMSYRGNTSVNRRLKQKDYPDLLARLKGLKVIGNNTMVAAVSAKSLAITQHLDHP